MKEVTPSGEQPHRQRLRLASFDYADQDNVYFVTIRAVHGSVPFHDPDLALAVVETLLRQRQTGRLRVYAYVLMPDHLHAAVSVAGGEDSLPAVLKDFKSYTTRLAWKRGLAGVLWQRSFYDHIARRAEDLLAICEYILANPVRSGLAREVSDWPYSGVLDQLPI